MLYPLSYEGGTVTLPSTFHAPLAGVAARHKNCALIGNFGHEPQL